MSNLIYDSNGCMMLDRLALNTRPSFELMQQAGVSATLKFIDIFPRAKKILVLSGSGNNGGDGFVFAKYAKAQGLDVMVVHFSNKFTKDTESAFNELPKDIKISLWKNFDKNNDYDVIVDAILGIGLSKPLAGEILEAVQFVNSTGINVFSLDIPTGLNADTGNIYNIAIKAHSTITFIGRKIGLLTGLGQDYSGVVYFDSLGVASDPQVSHVAKSIDYPKCIIKPRKKNAHKGCFGHILAIGGNVGMLGAIIIAGKTALQLGAGKVTIATKPENINFVTSNCLELLSYPLNQNLDLLLENKHIIVIGPGLGTDSWALDNFNFLIDNLRNRIIIDADALTLLAEKNIKYDDWILTPHPGEAAKLLGCSISEIESNRVEAAKEIQKKYHGVVVLKGSGTLIATQNAMFVCQYGSPVMATSGMGDLLCGIIASLVAQNLTLAEAAKYGVYLHGKAGENYEKQHGESGMLATDLVPFVKEIIGQKFYTHAYLET